MSTKRDSPIPDLSDDDPEDDDSTKLSELHVRDKVLGVGEPVYPYLVVMAGAGVGEMYRLDAGEAIVGRGEQAQFRIVDQGISRAHARLFRAGDLLYVQDLKSANGTLVNGTKITTCALRDGDKISIGSTTILKFTYHDRIDEAFQQKMYAAALRDGLTKTYNKRYMLDRLAAELAYARRHNTELALLMLDIDHFKRVNDTYGHPAGDAVLIEVAAVVQRAIRTEDILARYGGEEFAILCRNSSSAQASVFGQRICQLVRGAHFACAGKTIPITVSIGIAAASEIGASTPEMLIGGADAALYDAKRTGRDRTSVKVAK